MGAREILEFVLKTDATGAVQGFKAVGDESDKSLGKAEKNASNLGDTLTKVGAASMAAGLAVGAGLVGTVKAFEKSEAAANKFETAVTGMGSKIDTKRIKDLAFQLQQVSTVTDDQVVAAARWGAVYGLTTRQLEELLSVAVDLSAQTGKSLDVTTKALAKAAAGEGFTALTKLGLTFDETAYKADAFGTTVSEAMSFSGGAAAKQADTMTGQLTRMGNNWRDVTEQIGKGANEVFEPLAKGAADISEKLASANPELLKTVGHFAAIGSVGATAFGGLASIGGQLANLRDGFSGLGGLLQKTNIHLKDTEGNLTGAGKAAAGLGGAIAALGVLDMADGLRRSVADAGRMDESVKDLTISLSKFDKGAANSKEVVKDFWAKAGAVPDNIFTEIPQVFGKNIAPMKDVTDETIEDIETAFEEMSLGDQKGVLAAIEDYRSTLEDGSQTAKDMDNVLKNLGDRYKKNSEAAKATAEATGEVGQSEEDAEAAAKKWTNSLKEAHGVLGLLDLVTQYAAAGVDGFAKSVENADTDELVTSSLALGDALGAVKFNIGNLPKTFDEAKAAAGGYNKEQKAAIQTVLDWGEATKGQIENLIASGRSSEEVAAKANGYRDALTKVMHQAGLTDQQIRDYQETLGLTDEDITTAIRLSGDVEARFRLQLMQGALDKLDEGAQAEIYALIAEGKYQEADRRLTELTKPRDMYVWAQAAGWKGVPFKVPPGAAPAGTSVTAAGAVPMVGVNAQAAGTPVVVSVPAPTVTINLPAGSTPATTLTAIRRYQRLGGDMGGLLDTVAAIR